MMEYMYITNNPGVALIAEKNGVDRVWIDLETLGKEERQHNMNTVKSRHSIEDIRVIAPLLTKSRLMVRINPWNSGSKEEIEAVIKAGAQIIMLPMWKSPEEVQRFIDCVGGRAKVNLLLETKEADNCLDDVLEISGIDEIHIGLNDLHLSYGLTFMFELLANGTVERICNKIRAKRISYGFGGIARLGEGMLPAERILMEHFRLKSERVILSRSFCNADEISDLNKIDAVFSENMAALRAFELKTKEYSITDMENNRVEIVSCVDNLVKKIRTKERK